jgi:hypothetical protein
MILKRNKLPHSLLLEKKLLCVRLFVWFYKKSNCCRIYKRAKMNIILALLILRFSSFESLIYFCLLLLSRVLSIFRFTDHAFFSNSGPPQIDFFILFYFFLEKHCHPLVLFFSSKTYCLSFQVRLV